jgi:prepilin-type N-terminal cleavage/methylation domain-containing protein
MSFPSPASASPADAASRRAARAGQPSGFTIVELLVVMAIIAALMGLLLVGLQAARRTGKTTKEKSSLMQIYHGWMQYASNYDDAALPGYIEESVQQNFWKVKYKTKDKTTVPAQFAASYPHRLLPYIDHSIDTLYEYMEQSDEQYFNGTLADGTLNSTGLEDMALHPAFGYNGYYVGGYWREVGGEAKLRFGNAVWASAHAPDNVGKVVATKASGFADPSRLVLFCGSATRGPGQYKKDKEDELGAALVVPHILAQTPMWDASDGTNFGNVSVSSATSLLNLPFLANLSGQTYDMALVQSAGTAMQVLSSGDIGVPLRRFGNQITVLHADGNVTGAGLGELLDQSRWMNPAFEALSRNSFTHTDPLN